MSDNKIESVIGTLKKMQDVSEREIFKYMIDDLLIAQKDIESLKEQLKREVLVADTVLRQSNFGYPMVKEWGDIVTVAQEAQKKRVE